MTPLEPSIYLWKDLIHVGRFRHPIKGFSIGVDQRRLDHWVRTFNRMRANGVRVHIPADHSDAAADNRGYLVALKRVGVKLMGLCQLIGRDAIRDAARNFVSVGIAPKFIDGKGRTYRDAIVHLALTPVPVVPGQAEFKPSTQQRRANMAQKSLPCGDDTLSALHELVPGLADTPDEEKLDRILQHLQNLATAAAADDAAGPEELSTHSSSADPAAQNPAVRQALLLAIHSKRDLCVSRGALTPAVADALLAQLVPSQPSEDVIALSRADQNTLPTLALSIFSALADNRPVAPGERTAGQARAIARPVPGEAQNRPTPLYEKMAAMADGQRVEF